MFKDKVGAQWKAKVAAILVVAMPHVREAINAAAMKMAVDAQAMAMVADHSAIPTMPVAKAAAMVAVNVA